MAFYSFLQRHCGGIIAKQAFRSQGLSATALVKGRISVFHRSSFVMETTKTTFKNNLVLRAHLEHSHFQNRYSLWIGKWARASRCACREAIRLGEREARTAKQPQGPAPVRQRQVVSNSCFQKSEDSAVNYADAPGCDLNSK